MLESACPLDCPDACSLSVEVIDGRVTRLAGTTRNPITSGFICAKVRDFPRHLYCKERLLHPAIRTGPKGKGSFCQVSWDTALERIVEKITEVKAVHGGMSILPVSYGGSNGYLTSDTSDARLFYRLGASRLLRTVCAVATGAAAQGLYGKMTGVAMEDYEEAQLIVLWGVNPSVTGIHLVPFIRRAQKRGARLVVIDPRTTPLARKADLHMALRPGTDLVVALATIRHLFARAPEQSGADLEFLARHCHGSDELRRRARPWTWEQAERVSGVPAEKLKAFAQLYAASSPAVIRCGWGLERNRNGGSAAAAVLALPAVAGKFGVRGGGYTMSNSSQWRIDPLEAAGEAPPETRAVNMNRLGQMLLELQQPPLKLLFVYNCNPLATLPNQEKVREGLSREDLFTVVSEQVLTDTARFADVLLPATTFLEHEELRGSYGAMVLQRTSAVIPPLGEARPNYEVFAELCRRLKLEREGEPNSAQELGAAMLRKHPRLSESLKRDALAVPECGSRPIQFVDVFPATADAKVHLLPPELDAMAPQGLYRYQPDPATSQFPLALISPASGRRISSTFGQIQREQVALEMHPQDARVRGIEDGHSVRVFNELGEVHCHVRISEQIIPGVVHLPKGLWSHHTANGATANALVPDSYTDLGDGACFNDSRVEIERR